MSEEGIQMSTDVNCDMANMKHWNTQPQSEHVSDGVIACGCFSNVQDTQRDKDNIKVQSSSH